MDSKYQPVQIGAGTKTHVARKGAGPDAKALCGIKPNRNAGILRMTLAQREGTPVTCDKCLALLEKIEKQAAN